MATPAINSHDPRYPLAERLSDDSELRTLELIYLLRRYFLLARDAQWIEVVTELIELGKAAVPELIAEFDQTNDREHIETLGFVLCQINDARSVPALIRSITRIRRERDRSGCGESYEDGKKIASFLKRKKWWHSDRVEPKPWKCNGPCGPDIVHAAIERITGQDSPSDTGKIRLGWQTETAFHETKNQVGERLRLGWPGISADFLGVPDDEELIHELFRQRQQYWLNWWADHGKRFLSVTELARWNELSSKFDTSNGFDRIDSAGIQRLGAMFPTGPDTELTPIHKIEFNTQYIDSTFAIDFDRQRTFLAHEGERKKDTWETWSARIGINLAEDGASRGLRTWKVENERWKTIEEEVKTPGALVLRPEDNCSYDRDFYENYAGNKGKTSTFFFITDQGTSGILQATPAIYTDPNMTGYRQRKLMYRIWKNGINASEIKRPVTTTPHEYSDLRWGETTEVSLAIAAPGADCLWSFQSGDHVVQLPLQFCGDEWIHANGHPGYLHSVDQAARDTWPDLPEDLDNRLRTVDLMATRFPGQVYDKKTKQHRLTDNYETVLRVYNSPAGRNRILEGFSPTNFDQLSPAEALMHRDRLMFREKDDEGIYACLMIEEPTVALLNIRGRTVFLQIMSIDTDRIKLRYKLAI